MVAEGTVSPAGRGWGSATIGRKLTLIFLSIAGTLITRQTSRRVARLRAAITSLAQRIQQVIGKINDYSNTIAAAVEEQAATTNEMTRSISEAAENSRLVLTNFAAVAQVMNATSDAARASQNAADHLSGLVGKVNSLVGRQPQEQPWTALLAQHRIAIE
jgi:methyl-accepting chemotaxis protein